MNGQFDEFGSLRMPYQFADCRECTYRFVVLWDYYVMSIEKYLALFDVVRYSCYNAENRFFTFCK